MASQQIEEVPAHEQERPVLHEVNDGESTDEIEPALSQSQHSESFNAQSHNVSTSQSIGDGQSDNDDSNAPLSSRGSTRGTGDDGTMSNWGSDFHYITNRSRFVAPDADEEDKEEDGSPRLTNRFLFELFRKEWRKYYRTPELNNKLYLHYKGFSYIRNMAQFTQLKCLYFEGNGCRSLTGLETNVELRSLFVQENVIEKIEGLDNLTELRQLNLNDNMIKSVQGLAGCTNLDTLYLKRNRLGKDERGDVESLKGLLERPSLTCLDLSDNYLTDPEIVPEILMKLPNLKVLYLSGNDFTKKISAFRKTIIVKIPTLTYLDDRPVFEEDRRRAEAYARGGMEEERKEMRIIKKEKEDKHWANHEAFQLMISKAKREKKEAEEEAEQTRTEKKISMKEMMAKAKAEKEEKEKKALEGRFEIEEQTEEDKQFFKEMADKAETRFTEKQEGREHSEVVEDLPGNHLGKERSDEFDRKLEQEHEENIKCFEKAVAGADKTSPEKMPAQEAKEEEEEDGPPDLEEIDREELERTKQEKQQEWLNKVIAEESLRKKEEAVTPSDDNVDLEKEEENDTVDPEEILLDEKKVTAIQNEITKKDIRQFVGEQASAVEQEEPLQEGYTEFDELD